MRLGRTLVATVLVGVMMAPAAVAHDHRAPRATLFVGDSIQRGRSYHADWSRRDKTDPKFCIASFATGYPTFRRPVEHSPGEPVVVRLKKEAPPLEVEVIRWSGVDDRGYAEGQPHPLPWALRPHRVDGEIKAWDVVVAWPATVDHLYLGVAGYWADEEGCSGGIDLGNQYAAWTFHLKAAE